MLDDLWQDVRYAVRDIRSNPGFTAVAVLSLALGIGANTAIFSLIDAVMLRSLPVNNPEELLQLTMGKQDYAEGYMNPVWEQVRDRQDVFSGIFAYGGWRFNLAAGGEARYVDGDFVSGQFFDTLGVRTVFGRTLTPADDTRGCPGAAVLSHGFWQRQYGGRADVVGQTIALNNHPLDIVGVAEPGFTGLDIGRSVDVMVPICAEEIIQGGNSLLDQSSFLGWLRIIGRLKSGVSEREATTRLNTFAPQIFETTLPQALSAGRQEQYLKRTFEVRSATNGQSGFRRQYGRALIILMVIVGVVLLIACVNVANLQLARSAGRQREIAIRVALGAGRGRLLRQLLTESLLLSMAGATLGILFAQWSTSVLVGFLDVYLNLTLNLRLLVFTASIAVITGLLFGIVPAWRGMRIPAQLAMKANSRGVIERARFGLGKALVMAQVALSLLLVVGAGLMLSTFWRLASLDPGYERDQVLLMSVDIRNGGYTQERHLAVSQQMLEKLRTTPGVRSASLSIVPLVGLRRWSNELVIEGYAATSRDDATVYFNRISDGYFETVGIALVAGRYFDGRDSPTSPRVAIINQTMAEKYFGVTNPLGTHYRAREGDKLSDPIEIVGIVKDAKYGALRDEIPATAYVSWSQDGSPSPLMNFELRPDGGQPKALIPAVKSAIGEINRSVSLEFITLADQIDESLKRDRLLATLSGFFGGLALLLATIGLYGVMSYDVARRRNEIGIRMLLGAGQAQVLRMVLGEVALLIGIGLVVGLAVAMATTRFVASFLYGLAPNDPLTFSVATMVLAAAAFLAGYLPARRASGQNPMTVLREE